MDEWQDSGMDAKEYHRLTKLMDARSRKTIIVDKSNVGIFSRTITIVPIKVVVRLLFDKYAFEPKCGFRHFKHNREFVVYLFRRYLSIVY